MKSAARLPRSRTDNLVIRELDDETLVYDTERDKAHCLNRISALVWNQCDGKTSAAQAARSLQNELDVAIDTDLIWLAVKQLERFHLVESNGNSLSVSRRNLVLKYAPLALALPVIMSINAPTSAGGVASCLGQNAPCVAQGQPPCCSPFSCFGSPPRCQLG